MRTKTITFLMTLALLFSISSLQAKLGNVIPKGDLVNSFNDVGDLGFSDENSKKLMKQNESFVDDIFSIADSDDSDDDKKSALKKLKRDNDSKLDNLLGIDGAKKYRKKMKKTIRPYKRKMKLLKLAT